MTEKFQKKKCKICGNESAFFDEALVLQKYNVKYYRCSSCGFIQTEDPYWLKEAYESAIVEDDTGYVERNCFNAVLLKTCLMFFFPDCKRIVDYGRGYGFLVRLMRNRGFEFYGYDEYCQNLFAKEFEADMGAHYDFLTIFEVFEHLPDPASTIENLVKLSPNIFLSTVLVPEPAPKINDWWYYGAPHGQHISFYTKKSMEYLAKKYHLNFGTNGMGHHIFSEKKYPKDFFGL